MKLRKTSPTAAPPGFSVWHSLKLGLFQVGSSLVDLLTTGVINRLLIVEMGVAAWPVTLLTGLRYLIAPLSLWAGHRSDTRPLLGSRRTSYIWLGRLLILLSLPLLPLALAAIGHDSGSATGWLLLVSAFLLYSIGASASGAPYLALVHDSAPYERRGQVNAIVYTLLAASSAFVGFLYGRLLPTWDPALFWRLVMVAMVGAAFFWFISVWREERRAAPPAVVENAPSLRKTFASLWADPRARRYALFLGASAFFAFMQDGVLEPFGGDVFGLPVGETTRFNAYWGMGVLLAMVIGAYLTRRRAPDRQVSTTAWGLAILAGPLFLLALSSVMQIQSLLRPLLFVFGVGLGIFSVGGVALLMAMSREQQAGAYLALWSMVQLITRGAGIAAGGLLRDLGLAVTGSLSLAYGFVFAFEAVGLLVCILLLRRVDVPGFVSLSTRAEAVALPTPAVFD